MAAYNRTTKTTDVLPLAYFGMALLLVIVLLPSVLRQAPPEQNQTAEFSPDAPPDDEEQPIIASFKQASSGTAGTGDGIGPGDPGPGGGTGGAGLGPGAPAFCPGGFGEPKRQVESLYSTLCAPAFTGDNGGATSHGVSRNEFRVAFGSTNEYEGPVDVDVEGEEDNEAKRYLRVYQEYFNRNYQFYGRRMRVYMVQTSVGDTAQGAGAAVKAKQEYQAFATIDGQVTNHGWINESARQKMVTWVAWLPKVWFERNHPYGYSFVPDNDQSVDVATEVICKQLAGKPPSYNERADARFDYNAPRKFGVLLYTDASRTGDEAHFKRRLKECGIEAEYVMYNWAEENDKIIGSISTLRARGVTTVIQAVDWLTTVEVTREATAQGYFPEWFSVGVGGHGSNTTGQLQDPAQWRHSLGTSHFEIARPDAEKDWYRAYRSVDPNTAPAGGGIFDQLLQIANGVQGAGPKLTPHTFWEGIQKTPRTPPNPKWLAAGGYGPGDHSYTDWFTLGWWDSAAQANNQGAPGAYRYVEGGRRYTYGQIPTDPLPWFKDGVTHVSSEAS